MSELIIILKDDERTFRHKFLIYRSFTVSHDDEFLVSQIEEVKKLAMFEPDEIQIKISMNL
jgi:hypothetical protein